jgi:hypothetical protein
MGMDTFLNAVMSSYWAAEAIINVVVILIFCVCLIWRKR